MSLSKLDILIKRFNPKQPRWPAGSGDRSGEWMDIDALPRPNPKNMTVSYKGPQGSYTGRERRRIPRIEQNGLSTRDIWTDAERKRFRETGSPFDKSKNPEVKSSTDMLTTLRRSIDRAKENWKDSPAPGKSGALRWASKTGSVSWSDEVTDIRGEGKAGTYMLKGDTRRGFFVEYNSIDQPIPDGAMGLLRDPDGSRVRYLARQDAQDAAREFDEKLDKAARGGK